MKTSDPHYRSVIDVSLITQGGFQYVQVNPGHKIQQK